MPAIFMDGGDDVFTAITGPRPSKGLRQYIEERYDAFGRQLSETGRYIQQKVDSLFKMFDYDRHEHLASRLTREREALDLPNAIQAITELEFLCCPPDIMIEPIMAMPELRRRYHRQTVAGYTDRYVDTQPGRVEHEHDEYQRVAHGLWQEDKESGHHLCHLYADRTMDGDAYSHEQTIAIIDTWNAIHAALLKGEIDPTSPERASL